MTLSTNLVGNLIGRHLKHDIGYQSYNANTGRGYALSADGRVGFFVDFNHADGPKYAVSFSAQLSNADQNIRKNTADKFVSAASGFVFPVTDSTSTSTSSLFYKAVDARIVDFDTSSLGSVLSAQGLTAQDFSNTAMLIETWIAEVLNSAPESDVSANSGIRAFIAGAGGSSPMRTFKLWTENLMTDSGENALLIDPTLMTSQQKSLVIDGKSGFDFLSLYFNPTTGVAVNFSDSLNQTVSYGNIVLKMKNFEGADLTDFNDSFTGGNIDNTIFASKGDDAINGGGTWNTTDGTSSDRDWVQYVNGTAGITLKTSSNGIMTVTDYGGGKDTLTNIEAVGGTYYVDRLYGGTGNFNQIFNGYKGADIIDGGVGRDDRVWHTDDPSGVVVNLSSKSVSTQSVNIFANSLKLVGVQDSIGSIMVMKEAIDQLETAKSSNVGSNRALDGWGNLDILTNIEAATGSNFNDQLHGSDSRNILTGGDGFDFIIGNGGDDYLVGGFGHDFFHGGLGRDWIVMDELNWGNLTQTVTNTTYNYTGRFVRDIEQSGNMVSYKSVNESTVSNADIIDGFVVGDDLLDLTFIDANTKRAGNQQFDDSIVTIFTKKAGQLKISSFTNLIDSHNYSVSNAVNGYKLSGTEVQGDINGDGVADFSVKLVGVSFNNTTLPGQLQDSILF
jgi:hypothetical protein